MAEVVIMGGGLSGAVGFECGGREHYSALKDRASSFLGDRPTRGFRLLPGLTPPPLAVASAPPANIRSPSARMFFAALMSRSWCAPQ